MTTHTMHGTAAQKALFFAIVLGGGSLIASTDADAATARYSAVASTADCHATNPADAPKLRFRHLGVFNMPDSGSQVQIACSLPADLLGEQTTGDVIIFVKNYRTSPVDVNCTVHGGSRYSGTNSYPATISVAAGETTWRWYYDVDKTSAGNLPHYNITCVLPQNVEISTIGTLEADADGEL